MSHQSTDDLSRTGAALPQYSPMPSFRCSTCGLLVPNSDTLEAHIALEHVDYLPYSCSRCSFVRLPTEYAVRVHFAERHNDENTKTCVSVNTSKAQRLKCLLRESEEMTNTRRPHRVVERGSSAHQVSADRSTNSDEGFDSPLCLKDAEDAGPPKSTSADTTSVNDASVALGMATAVGLSGGAEGCNRKSGRSGFHTSARLRMTTTPIADVNCGVTPFVDKIATERHMTRRLTKEIAAQSMSDVPLANTPEVQAPSQPMSAEDTPHVTPSSTDDSGGQPIMKLAAAIPDTAQTLPMVKRETANSASPAIDQQPKRKKPRGYMWLNANRFLSCHECGKQTYNNQSCKCYHIWTAHLNTHLYQCNYCEKGAYVRSSMLQHAERHHKGAAPPLVSCQTEQMKDEFERFAALCFPANEPRINSAPRATSQQPAQRIAVKRRAVVNKGEFCECHECGKQVRNEYSRRRHHTWTAHLKAYAYQCNYCDMGSHDSRKRVLQHAQRYHEDADEPLVVNHIVEMKAEYDRFYGLCFPRSDARQHSTQPAMSSRQMSTRPKVSDSLIDREKLKPTVTPQPQELYGNRSAVTFSTCLRCERPTLNDRVSKIRHVWAAHLKTNRYQCNHCDAGSFYKGTMMQHVERKHKDAVYPLYMCQMEQMSAKYTKLAALCFPDM